MMSRELVTVATSHKRANAHLISSGLTHVTYSHYLGEATQILAIMVKLLFYIALIFPVYILEVYTEYSNTVSAMLI